MRETRYIFPAFISVDGDGRHVVRFPDLPEALTDGANLAEALAEAQDALSAALIGYVLEERAIPRPKASRRARHMIAPHPRTSLKVALAVEAKRRGLRAVDLARRLDIDHKEARRMLDPRHPTKADRLAEALRALGLGVSVGIYEAA